MPTTENQMEINKENGIATGCRDCLHAGVMYYRDLTGTQYHYEVYVTYPGLDLYKESKTIRLVAIPIYPLYSPGFH